MSFVPSFDLDFPGLEILSDDPPVFQIKNFLSDENCAKLIHDAQRDGEEIKISRTFMNNQSHSQQTRNSTTWYLNFEKAELLVNKVQRLTGKSLTTFEELQIVRYTQGQQYDWHVDAVPKGSVNRFAGNRLITVLVYLNDITSDDQDALNGATAFSELNINVKPERGKCLVFFPCFSDGSPDMRTRHCGLPVRGGDQAEKWIAQIWVHQRDYL